MGGGSAFSDSNNPTPVVKVGDTGSSGIVEITDMLFMTKGPGETTPHPEHGLFYLHGFVPSIRRNCCRMECKLTHAGWSRNVGFAYQVMHFLIWSEDDWVETDWIIILG